MSDAMDITASRVLRSHSFSPRVHSIIPAVKGSGIESIHCPSLFLFCNPYQKKKKSKNNVVERKEDFEVEEGGI